MVACTELSSDPTPHKHISTRGRMGNLQLEDLVLELACGNESISFFVVAESFRETTSTLRILGITHLQNTHQPP